MLYADTGCMPEGREILSSCDSPAPSCIFQHLVLLMTEYSFKTLGRKQSSYTAVPGTASPWPTSCSLGLLLVLIVGLLALKELLSAAGGAHMLHADMNALGDDPVTNLQALMRLSTAAQPKPTTWLKPWQLALVFPCG